MFPKGYPGITEEQCLSKQCCWDKSVQVNIQLECLLCVFLAESELFPLPQDVPWCFKKVTLDIPEE